MKPLRLKLNAFGPYASEQEIDFSKMDSIYLITGPTGAGKTTIFDGISFALFGKTSGKEREPKDLKSDFGEGDAVTFVELEFLLHGEVYTIRREPTQIMKGRKTKRNHSVELHLPNGKLINKVNEADEKIEELLGLNVEQFRQIVMLPQGEFKKLIESTTEEKEIIFRKIFSSKIYKDFQDRLKDRSSLMRRDLEKYRDRRITLLKKVEPGDSEKLKELIESENININETLIEVNKKIQTDSEELLRLKNEKKEAIKKIEKLTKNIDKVKDINRKLERLVELRKSLEALKSREAEILLNEQKSSMAKKAKEAVNFEDNLIESRKTLQRKKEEKVRLEKDVEDNNKELEKLRLKLKELEGKEEERKSLEKRLHELESKVNSFKEYEDKLFKLQIEEKILKDVEDKLALSLKNKEEKSKTILNIERFLEDNKSLEVDILSFEGKVKENSEDITKLREFYKRIEILKSEIENHSKISKEYNTISSVYSEKNKYYEEKDEEIKREKAGILASSLIKGEPCPVCGSTNHPDKATLSSSTLTEKEIKSLKEEVEKIKNSKEETLRSAATIKAKIDEMLNGVILDGFKKFLSINEFSIEDIDSLQEQIKQKGSALRECLGNNEKVLLEKKNQLKLKNSKKEEKEKTLLEIDVIEKDIKSLEGSSKEAFGKCEALKEAKESLEKSLNGEVKSLSELESIIKDTKEIILKMEEELGICREEERKSTIKLTSSIKNLENKVDEIKEATIYCGDKEKAFNNKLQELNISYEVFKTSLLNVQDIEELDKAVEEYKESLLSLMQQIKDADEETKGKELESTNSLEEEKHTITIEIEEKETKEKIVYSRWDNNSKTLDEVTKLSEGIGDRETHYSIVSELSNMANGFNPRRITFERYVLAHHFSEILEAANIRFKAMTNERYYLERKVEITDGRKGQGLDFDVYDNYTGKTRSIKSLSGGESFKASLALALGLSDVIQSSAGGVRIDAMFIDEGFGTLDPQSLEKAIETLLELGGGGKTVGVISHVPELRERIRSKIEVGKSKRGSCIKTVVE